jgi:uridine kinase
MDTFANDLKQALSEQGLNVIRASIKGFQNPIEFRYQRGKNNPEGYYLDNFNYRVLFEYLLNPLGLNGSREYRTEVFNYEKDEWIKSKPSIAPDDAILIFDGVFLLRPELNEVWDLRVYLDISYEENLKRAIEGHKGNPAKIIEKYNLQYIPGQKLYHMHAGPKRKANIIINNKYPENPELTYLNHPSVNDLR